MQTVLDDCRPLDPAELTNLSHKPACRRLETTSTMAIYYSSYSFYHPTEGRRLSRPRWLVTYPDVLPIHNQSPIHVATGHSVNKLQIIVRYVT